MSQAKMFDSSYLEICQRTLNGAYRLIPTPLVNALIRYTLWRAASATGVEIVAVVFMANHYHCIAYSPDPKKLSAFCQRLNSGLAKGLNQVQDEHGQVWTREPLQTTPIYTFEHLMSRLQYLSGNPVRAGIAQSRHDHVGVIFLPEFANEEHVAKRPSEALGVATQQPLEVYGKLHIPRGLMPEEMSDEAYMELARTVCDESDEIARSTNKRGGSGLPERAEMERLADQMWADEAWLDDGPNEREKAKERARKGGPPRFFAKGAAAVRREQMRQAKFQRLYCVAMTDWLIDDGRDVVFPHGTLKMAGMPRVVVGIERIEV